MTAPLSSRLVWLGQRGDDSDCLEPHGGLAGIVCCDWSAALARLSRRVPVESLERDTRVRLVWSSANLERSPGELVRAALRGSGPPLTVVPYRNVAWLEDLARLAAGKLTIAGPPLGVVKALDDKVQQRRLFAEWAIPTPRWIAAPWRKGSLDGSELRFPLVVQRRVGSLGLQTVRVASAEDIDRVPGAWAADDAVLISELEAGVVVNVTVAIGHHRGVWVAWPSIQLAGEETCGAGSEFLYCGNDFSAFGQLPPAARDAILALARRVGARLAERSYRGIFGLDLIYRPGSLLALEINPRWQGSTPCLTECERRAGAPSTVSIGLGSWLSNPDELAIDGATPDPIPLSGAEIVLYAERSTIAREPSSDLGSEWQLRNVPVPGTRVIQGAMLGRLRFTGGVLLPGAGGLTRDAERLALRLRAETCQPP